MATTGSVLALQYKGGLLLACDTLVSYGSLAIIPNVSRCVAVTRYTVISSSGSFSDFQSVVSRLRQICHAKRIEQNYEPSPSEVFTLLQRLLYSMRSDMKPLQCTIVVAGIHSQGPAVCERIEFIGVLDNLGTHWTAEYAGTSYAQHIAVPLIREHIEKVGVPDSREDALDLLQRSLRILFYRECRSSNRWIITDISSAGITQMPPRVLDTSFSLEGYKFDKTAVLRV
uniref:Proteasome subunit beta n=1 Tax=Paramoeba aestuarina TaxID=180227 RepID=A0A7S4KS99_9EUKA|mmetsp:Transcript_24483/g.38179  ORF Transcript_24483/g.38179 Transcript_24483/m.38179 type:complete len:228 (+) Transcript_24483:33-716(+)